MSFTIRRGTLNDVEVIAELLTEVQRLHAAALPHFFKEPPSDGLSADVVHTFVENPENLIFLAEERDADSLPDAHRVVVGYLCAAVRSVDENTFTYANKTCHIEHLSVRPDRQHAGHGSRLMQAVRAYAEEQGATILSLDVWDFNQKAQRFFQGQGYVPARHRLVIWSGMEE